MANGRISFIVKAPNGTDLRREPHTNSKTEGGEDNVILSLPKGTYVLLENVDIYATDKYRWVLVSLNVESKTTGWVIFDDLVLASLEASSVTYPVNVGRKKYKIFGDKLDDAKGQYIFPTELSDRIPRGMRRITIEEEPQKKQYYLTTDNHIKTMKTMRFIIEK